MNLDDRPAGGRIRLVERACYVALVLYFIVFAPLARMPIPYVAGFRGTVFLTSAFASTATFVVLIALWRAKPRPPVLLLAQAYALAAVAALAALFALPDRPGTPALLRADAHAAPYVYLTWHIMFGLMALLYVGVRVRAVRGFGPARTVNWFAPLVIPGAITLAAMVAVAVAAASHLWLPAFRPGQRFVAGPPFYADIAGLVLTLAACAAVMRIPRRDYVDRALGVTLAGFAVELALNIFSTAPQSVGWSAARALMLASLTFVLIGTGAQLIATYRGAFALRDRLRIESARSSKRSRRMDALWTLARDPVRDEERLARIIDEGARALSVTDGSVAGRLVAADDLDANDDAELAALAELSFAVRVWAQPRPSVAASFGVERRTYILHFTRREGTAGFDADDLTFVQVLSTLCAEILEEIGRRERLQFHTEREMLTGLYNPTMLRSRLVGAVRAGNGALLTVRIANLREIGRTLGRLAADAIVVEIAALLERNAMPNEIVARAGDDSFGVLLQGTSSADVAVRVMTLASAIDRSFDLGDRTGRAAIDVISRLRAVIFEPGNDAEAVLTQASFEDDAGLASERVRIVTYDPEHNRRYAERRDLLGELRTGIERGDIGVYYQPYIDLRTGAVVGAEALMRWFHPERGVLEPRMFMPLAQEWGLMPAMGRSVIARVFDEIARMRKTLPELRVYINLDAAGFEASGLIDGLLARAARAGVPPAAIGVEITETTAMRDVAAAQAVMEGLRTAGFAIALDDFGTGFSSLAYLKHYPVDVIKIDRSFVAGLPQNPFDIALIGAILAVAAAFGMKVHAEGIETPAQALWLRENGCLSAQGYYYARPLPIEEFLTYTAINGAGISADRT